MNLNLWETKPMTRNLSLTLALLGAFAAAATAQEPKMPTPGPEHKKLAYFAGTWKTEAEMKAMPPFPGGKMTGTDRVEVFPGGFFVVNHSTVQGPMGPLEELEVMGYDSKEKVYTYDGYNSYGEHETYKGTVDGDTWTWTGDSDFGGTTMKGRFVAKVISPTAYNFRFDFSPDGTSWTNIMEGKATKAE
jgi:Protein of unknown function (DUF1579)